MTRAPRVAGERSDSGNASMRPLRPWDRLGLRLAVVFAVVTVLAVGLVGGVIYQRQKREVEDTVGTQLLNISRVAALMVDPALHAEVQRTRRQDSEAYARISKTLATIKGEVLLTTPIYTLTDYDAQARQARVMVSSGGPSVPGELYPWSPKSPSRSGGRFEDGVARYTRAYRNQRGTWISAFAPIVDAAGRSIGGPVRRLLGRHLSGPPARVAAEHSAGVAGRRTGAPWSAGCCSPVTSPARSARSRPEWPAWRPEISREPCPCARATRSVGSPRPSTRCWKGSASATSFATPSVDTSRPKWPRRCWNPRRASASAARSERSPSSCRTCAATRSSPSAETPPGSWTCSTSI